MPLSDIVNVIIELATAGLSVPGFGIPGILGYSSTFPDRVRFYTSIDGVLVDYAASTPEAIAAAAIFAQDVHPERIAIFKGLLKPTQRFKLSVVSVVNSYAYTFKVGSTTVTFTSDASATNDEIATGLMNAINTAAPAGFTATTSGSVGSLFVYITGNAPGNWLATENLQPDFLALSQDHADPGVATDLAQIKLLDNTWYGLITLFNSSAYILGAAAWVESNEKLYIPVTQDSEAETVAFSSATDVVKTIYTLGYTRTAVEYHRSNLYFADAAWFGATLSFDPGSETWKFKTLNGVPPVTLTTTQQTNLQNKRANIYYAIAGRNITAEGITASGQFIDTIRFRDWLKLRLQVEVFLELANSPKVPYTDPGIAKIENRVRAVLDEGVAVGGIAQGSIVVTVPKVVDTSPVDKAERILRNMFFECDLASAIHGVLPIRGRITL